MNLLNRLKTNAIALASEHSGDFARGWAEGIGRYNRRHREIVEGSRFEQGTTAFAASQAAVAFCIGREK